MLAAAVLAAGLLVGCGNAKSATTAARCPSHETLISGRFHATYCVPTRDARTATICSEALYELRDATAADLGNPSPTDWRDGLLRAVHDGEVLTGKAESELRRSSADATAALDNLARHRKMLRAFGRKVRRATSPPNWSGVMAEVDIACSRL